MDTNRKMLCACDILYTQDQKLMDDHSEIISVNALKLIVAYYIQALQYLLSLLLYYFIAYDCTGVAVQRRFEHIPQQEKIFVSHNNRIFISMYITVVV